MNKLSIFFIVAIFSIMSFSIGYKYGDARGYDAGYKEGYTYDCQAEIRQLREEHRQVKEAVKIQEEMTARAKKAVDSLNYEREFHVRDSIMYQQFKKDSLKNWMSAKRYNDSLLKVGSRAPRKCPDGKRSGLEALLSAAGHDKPFTGLINCNNRQIEP